MVFSNVKWENVTRLHCEGWELNFWLWIPVQRRRTCFKAHRTVWAGATEVFCPSPRFHASVRARSGELWLLNTFSQKNISWWSLRGLHVIYKQPYNVTNNGIVLLLFKEEIPQGLAG